MNSQLESILEKKKKKIQTQSYLDFERSKFGDGNFEL